MELGLSTDMFSKYIGGVFPTVYATGVSCLLQRAEEFVPS